MIVRMFRYFLGFLDIKLEGVYSEKVLSEFAKNRISVWRLKYVNGCIYCRVFVKDFRKIRQARKNTGVRVKIIKKHGLPFLVNRYNHRFGFIAGAALFFAALEFLSGFIWVINISGNSYVKSSDIIRTLSEIGIHEAMKSKDINPKDDAQQLLIGRDDLAWASLNIEGSVLNVNVSEIKKTEERDNSVPTNIIAKTDGIIRRIDAVSGNVRVKIGDNVHKGDILVSGIIENLSSTVFLKSNATVVAQIEKTYEIRENYRRKVKVKNGKTARRVLLCFFGANIPLFLPEKENNADCDFSVTQAILFDKKVPIKIYKKEMKYYDLKDLSFSEIELKNTLEARLNGYFSNRSIDGYIPVSTAYIPDENGIVLKCRYLCDEDIGIESKIIVGQ